VRYVTVLPAGVGAGAVRAISALRRLSRAQARSQHEQENYLRATPMILPNSRQRWRRCQTKAFTYRVSRGDTRPATKDHQGAPSYWANASRTAGHRRAEAAQRIPPFLPAGRASCVASRPVDWHHLALMRQQARYSAVRGRHGSRNAAHAAPTESDSGVSAAFDYLSPSGKLYSAIK
jgi:hypothetical protein